MTTIKDFPTYTIDEDGTITNKHGRIMAQRLNHKGYFRVGLYKNGKQYYRFVHRLLGEAFIPNPDNKPCIDHIDRNRQNNSLDNLRWATLSENGQNRTISENNTSGYENITHEPKKDLWRFRRELNGVKVSKRFKKIEDAIAFRDEWILNNWGTC